MKSTITLKGDRRAVVEIPYSKLMPAQASKPQVYSPCCESKIVFSGGSNRGQSSLQLKRMVEQLEQAYDKDVRELQEKISHLQLEKASIAAQQMQEKTEYAKDFSLKKQSYDKDIELLRQQCRRKDNEIRKLVEQKQILIRNKISEFKQVQYINKLNEQEHIIRLKDSEINSLMRNYELTLLDKSKMQEMARLTQSKLESQISRLSIQLSEATSKFSNEQSNMTYRYKLKEQQDQKLMQQLKYQLQLLQRSLRQSEYSIDAKSKHNLALTEKSGNLQTKNNQLESQATLLKGSISELTITKNQLSSQLLENKQTITALNSQRDQLLGQLNERTTEILALKRQLQGKERVYEVKIERVIDGKEEIDELQAAIFELEQQLKQITQDKDYLAEDLKKWQKNFEDLNELKLKLQAQITGLKAYISKRESSFRWLIEREIQKDIAVSDQKPQMYKVSQINEYSRQAKEDSSKIISEQIALNMQANLFGSYPQQIIIQNSNQ